MSNDHRLERAWQEEVKSRGEVDARLGRAIRAAYSKRLVVSVIVILTTLTFSFVGSACILRLLLDHVSAPNRTVWVGVAIVCSLIACEVCRSLTFSLAWCLNYWTGMRVREAAMGLLYKKMLRLRSLKDKKIGELVNMCSNDGQRLFEVMANAPFIVGGPCVFVAGSVYLGFIMGLWALLGVATYVVFFILMKFVADALEHYRQEAVTLTGERVGLMTEVLTCMKLIKMNAWEPSFISRITKKRREEQRSLEKASFLQSIITSLVPMIPVIASVVMFTAFILTGHHLTVTKAFTVIAVLYAVSFSLALMIHGVRTIADANVACERYKEVLLMEEVMQFPDDLEGDIVLEMSCGTFTWEAEDEEQLELTDEDSVIAGLNAEEFDPLASSFHSRLSGTGGGPFPTAVNHKMEDVDVDLDADDSVADLLSTSHDGVAGSCMGNDTTGIPQLCGVDLTVKKGELCVQTIVERLQDELYVFRLLLNCCRGDLCVQTVVELLQGDLCVQTVVELLQGDLCVQTVVELLQGDLCVQTVVELLQGDLCVQTVVELLQGELYVFRLLLNCCRGELYVQTVVELLQGELIGICGMKGSGKSSFLSAIMGRMQLLSGTTKVTGRIAYVGQDPWIINGTARENILFGQPYDEARFKQTVSACYLDKDFETFGAGDRVEIGDRGLTLSGGQKQRISLARAMYSNSDIYLLDDPLSALDVHIGRHVFAQCLKVMLKGKTVLFVTHHLEYLPKCDRVALLHEGRLVEVGTHSELLGAGPGAGPMYTELYQLYQSKYEKVQRHRLMSFMGPQQDGGVKTPQRGFSRLTRRTLSKQLSRMSASGVIQHQFSTMSTTSAIFGDYEYVDLEDLVDAQELADNRVSWSVYGEYIRAMGGYAVLAFLFISFALSIGVQSATTWFLAFWLNQGDGVKLFAMVYGLFLVAMLLVMVFRSIVFVKIMLRAASSLHRRLLKRTMTCPMKFFDTTPLGIILNRFSADIDEIDVRLPSNCELYLQNVFLVFFALVIICYAFPWDLVVVVPLAVVFAVLAVVFAPVVQQLKFVDSITRSPYLSHLAASVEGVATIHAYGQSERFFKQFCEMLNRNNIPFFLFYAANRWLAIFLDLMTVIIIGVTGFLVIFTVTDKTASQAGLALTFAVQITSLLQYTLRLTIETGSRFSSVQRVQEYIENLQTEGTIASSNSEVPSDWPDHGAITFNKYRMRYNDCLPLALKGVTLTIKPKEKIGIVGNSGS
ncbi:hypothetical protein BaRGS_00034354, partial [Batillaria attramentaria]